MTEAEWLKCEDVEKMLDYLREKATPRKLRLFAFHCCRPLVPLLKSKEAKDGLEVLEKFVEGKAHRNALSRVCGRINQKREKEYTRAIQSKQWETHTCYLMLMSACQQKVDEGARTLFLQGKFHPTGYLTVQTMTTFFRDIFGNPFRPTTVDLKCLTPTVNQLALAIYDDRSFDRLPILADLLQEAGCDQEEALQHLRSGSEHVRGCWALDLVRSVD